MDIIHSTAASTLFGLFGVYFLIKFLAVSTKLWTPRNRAQTLDEAKLKRWRVVASLESLGVAALWLGLLMSNFLPVQVLLVSAVGAVVYFAAMIVMRKQFPYIDPSTVKKSGGKKKKKN